MNPMCLKLVGSMLDLKTVEVFRDIGNKIGTFLEDDKHIKVDTSHSVAFILIEIDLRDNLVEVMEIEMGSCCCVHNHLDYV